MLQANEGEDITITQSGYIYIFVSNSSGTPVQFDDLSVIRKRSALLEETHYYPFGLAMSGISSKATETLTNKYKFNGGTELNNDFDISIYETPLRGYDPQIGRFGQTDILTSSYPHISPYAFVHNNPISYNDPSGALDVGEFNKMVEGFLNSSHGGTWNAITGGGGHEFASEDEAMGFGMSYMTEHNLWGAFEGWAGSSGEALTNFNGGGITRDMAAGAIQQMHPEFSGVTVKKDAAWHTTKGREDWFGFVYNYTAQQNPFSTEVVVASGIITYDKVAAAMGLNGEIGWKGNEATAWEYTKVGLALTGAAIEVVAGIFTSEVGVGVPMATDGGMRMMGNTNKLLTMIQTGKTNNEPTSYGAMIGSAIDNGRGNTWQTVLGTTNDAAFLFFSPASTNFLFRTNNNMNGTIGINTIINTYISDYNDIKSIFNK